MDLDRRNILLLLFLIIFAGSALRLYNLGSASIRADEGGAIYLSELPAFDILTTPQDVQPPLFYFILHFWIEIFGKSEFALRLLPALLSIIAIPIVYFLGKELFDNKVALFSALVFAVSQANIRFAQTLRMYSLLLIFALLSIYFLYKYLENPSGKNATLYAVTSALSIYSHYFAGFLLVAEFVYAVLFFKRHNAKILNILGMFAFAGLLAIPLIKYHFLWQLSIKTGLEQALYASDPLLQISFTSLSQNNIFVRLGLIFYHFSVGFLLVNLKSKLFLAVLGLAGIVFSISLISSIKKLYASEKTRFWFLISLLAIPALMLVVMWAMNIIPRQTYTRYLLYLSPLYYMLVGYGIFEAIPKLAPAKISKILTFSLIALIVLFNAISLNYYYKLDSSQENWKKTSAYLNENYNDGDLILMYSGSYFYNLNYSFGKGAAYSLPGNTNLNSATLAEVYDTLAIIDESNACNVKKLLSGAETAFIVRPSSGEQDSAQPLLNKCLSESGFSLKDTFESSYINQKGETIADIFVYQFER